jgi:hypothetical protein
MERMKLSILIAAASMSTWAACAVEVADEQDPEIAVASEAIFNGNPEVGHGGVISFEQNGVHRCTGVMISPFHAVTAAHCTDQGGTRRASGTMKRNVFYFDPDYWAPDGGKRKIFPDTVNLKVTVIDTWDGLANAGALDWQDDLAIVTSPTVWADTGWWDYQQIWVGSITTVDKSTFYGAGGNGVSAGALNSMPIDIAGSKDYYFWDVGRTRRICVGDSGGPYIDIINGKGEVVFGIAAVVDRDGGPCTTNGGKQYGARLNSRINWIRANTSGLCSVSDSVARCFSKE